MVVKGVPKPAVGYALIAKQIIYAPAKNVNKKIENFQGFYGTGLPGAPEGKYSSAKSTFSTVNTLPRRYSSTPASVGKVNFSL